MLSDKLANLIGLIALGLLCVSIAIPSAVRAQDIIGPGTQQVKTITGPYTVIAEAKPLPSLQAASIIVQLSSRPKT